MEALGGQLGFLRGSLFLRRLGAQILLRVNAAGHYILSVVDFRKHSSRSALKCPDASGSRAYLVQQMPNVSSRGLHSPYTPEGLFRFEPPRTLAACKAVTLGDARTSSLTDPEMIATKIHVRWGHAAAQQLKRVLFDWESNNSRLITCVYEVFPRREFRQAFEKVPHALAAGTPTVAMSNEELQVGLLFPDDIIASRVMDVSPKYSVLIPVRTKNPREVWDNFRSS